MIIQAVNRVYHPGCQADLVVILEGNQGIGKSRLVRLLGGEYYASLYIDPGSKDTVDAMRGKWFIEMAEMAVYGRKEADKLKQFISNTIDDCRPAYARRSVRFERQSVFIGTFNPDATGQYLTDATGNRRFAPMNLGGGAINEAAIKKIRDQIFAEAYYLVLNGEATYIHDGEINKLLEREQNKRMSADTLMEPVTAYIYKHEPYFISITDVWVKALQGDVKQQTIAHSRRIAIILRNLGYTNKTIRTKPGVTKKVWVNNQYETNNTAKEGLFD